MPERTNARKRNDDLLDRIFDSANILIAILDTDFNFIQVNKTYALSDGKEPEFYEGKNHFKLYPHEENRKIFEKVRDTGIPYYAFEKAFDYAHNPKRGTTYWDWSLLPIKDNSGEVTGLIMTLVDVTERKKQEGVLSAAREELKNAKRLSDIGTLAATVAHELRNPLGVISMAAYNIRQKCGDKILNKHIANIEKKVEESNRIITNLLTYTRLKNPQFKKIKIYNLLDEISNNVKKRFKKEKVELKKNLKSVKDMVVEVDPFQIQEVINNILTNAYQVLEGQRGLIEISARIENNREPAFLIIEIKDNGPGIAAEDKERIFEPFFTKKSKGTGLGLSISQELLALHYGELNVESELKKGTSVSVKLPLKQA